MTTAVNFDARCKKIKIAHLREKVVVDLHAAVREHLREKCGRADEEVIADDVRYRFLILIAIIYSIPIGVLKQDIRDKSG